MAWIVLDYETASGADLKLVGADRYAEDLSTEILCLAWESDQGERGYWLPGQAMPPEMARWIADDKTIFVAHNARFERAIWREQQHKVHGWPDLPASKWHDTMARCAQVVLPQKLEQVLVRLDIPALKDTEGSKLTIGLSKLNKAGYFPARTPEVMRRVVQYNLHDIDSQVALHRRLGWLADGERKVWLLDQLINDRGIGIDVGLVRNMQAVVDRATTPLAAEFRELTGGLEFTQTAKVMAWARDRGATLPNLQKETIAVALKHDVDMTDEEIEDAREQTGEIRLDPSVYRALEIRQLVGSAAIKKLGRMRACTCHDGRAHGLLNYHGAGPGRWSGRLLQPQNFPRGTIKGDIDQLVAALSTGDPSYVETVFGPAVETVVSSLRYALVAATGATFVAGDFASIEARVALALAGQWDKVALLASGADVYCDMASSIYNRPITKADAAERQTGKNSVLGLGFQMGARKFYARYCQDQSLEFAQNVVDTYRKDWAPLVPKLWRGLNDAAVAAVHNPGAAYQAFGVEYVMLDKWLTARLPSGRRLWYFGATPTHEAMPWDADDIRPGFSYWAMKMQKWTRIKAYGGLLTENVVQAIARDLLRDAAFRAERNGFPIVLTVHDELVTEVPRARADLKALEQIMSEREPWAAALNIPVATEGWVSDRYRK